MELKPADAEFMAALSTIAPRAKIKTDGHKYREDPRNQRHGQDGVVVAPSNTEEVSAILGLCNCLRVPVVPYGGGTGLVGGQLPSGLPRPLILSLERMNRIREVKSASSVITAEAGCSLQTVQSEAGKSGQLFPLELASKGTCQVGGNLATNAGGSNVVRYGNMRSLCLGIEAVFADGGVWHGLTGLIKDNRGLDLRNLLIGSEGTLAVITAACLKLFPLPVNRSVILASIEDPSTGLKLFELTRRRFGQMLSAFELISRVGIDFLRETGMNFKVPYNPMPDWMVLIDLGSESDIGIEDLALTMLEEAQRDSLISDALLAASDSQIAEFWNIRESIPTANRRIGAIGSHDISLPIDTIPEFITVCGRRVAAIGDLRVNCFGHIGDGNLHYNVFPPYGGDVKNYRHYADEVRLVIHQLVREFGGSTTAEHGTGRLMAAELSKFGDKAFMKAVAAIKSALDPNGILNPGAVIERSKGD